MNFLRSFMMFGTGSPSKIQKKTSGWWNVKHPELVGKVYHCTGSSVPFDLEREAYVILFQWFLWIPTMPSCFAFWWLIVWINACNNFGDSGLPSTKGGGGDIGGGGYEKIHVYMTWVYMYRCTLDNLPSNCGKRRFIGIQGSPTEHVIILAVTETVTGWGVDLKI